MADFTAEVYQNEFLPDGGTDVHAIVTVTCTSAGAAGQAGEGEAGEIVIVDTSGSMGEVNIRAAQHAAAAAIDQIIDGTWFAVIAGTHEARMAFPAGRAELGMVQMDSAARAAAKGAVSRFKADGGTAMGTWLTLAARVFTTVPSQLACHSCTSVSGVYFHCAIRCTVSFFTGRSCSTMRDRFRMNLSPILLLILCSRCRAGDNVDYQQQIKPMLMERCASCHGAIRQQGGLRLDAAELLKRAAHCRNTQMLYGELDLAMCRVDCPFHNCAPACERRLSRLGDARARCPRLSHY